MDEVERTVCPILISWKKMKTSKLRERRPQLLSLAMTHVRSAHGLGGSVADIICRHSIEHRKQKSRAQTIRVPSTRTWSSGSFAV